MPHDIAVNITDPQYLGEYCGSKKHPCDVDCVVARSKKAGVKMIFLGTSVKTSVESIGLANEYREYATIGIHPGSTLEASQEDICQIKKILEKKSLADHEHLIGKEIKNLLSEKSLQNTESLVGIGEIGLDYYRDYSPREKQREVFKALLDATAEYNLPYVFHYRECGSDFFSILSAHSVEGVVHSYTGTLQEMKKILELGYYIGVNGASIRENEKTGVIEKIPKDRLLIETDAPWCSIRKTSKYAGAIGRYLSTGKKWKKGEGVKGRNEPVNLHEVIDAVCSIRSMSREELVEITDKNFRTLFKIPEETL